MTFAVPPTRGEAVVRQLRTEIVSGQMQPGTILRDAELATRFGVSITPVREAIAQLATEGLVDTAPNRTRRVTRLTQQSALEVIDVMELLSCAGVEWGIGSLKEVHLEQLRQHLGEFEQGLEQGDTGAVAAAGAAFSAVLISGSGNRELQHHIDLLVARTLRILSLKSDSELWRLWLDGYRDVLRAVDSGDTAQAVARYRQIFPDYKRFVKALFAESDDR